MVTPLRILGNDAALATSNGVSNDVDSEVAVRAKRVFIETFGCQMNVLDSELVRDQLLQQGYRFVSSPDDADVVLYNTCSVRDQSEQKVLSRLGVMRRRKQERPELVVGMLGCMAERAGDLAVKKGADVVVGPSELDRLPELLERAFAGQGRQVALSGHTARRSRTLDEAMDRLEALDQGRLVDPDQATSQAYVRITRGCNKFCSFCVVPYTRGPEVHREPNAIVAEVTKLVDAGAQEVTLLGQTINHYRHTDAHGVTTSFAALLARVHDEHPKLARLRFLTSYPRDFGDDALDVMATRDRICAFLHVPAQSGSDAMLARMNRGYTRAQYLDLIGRAKQRMPNVAIVGDMIVGYPGETDDDFEQSLSLLREVRYKTVYVFKYSPRPGTVAAIRLADDVPDELKRERNLRMLELQQQISLEHHTAMIGSTVEVLVEGAAKIDPQLHTLGKVGAAMKGRARLTSRTAGDHIVAFDGDASMIGKRVPVRITRASTLSLQGEVA